MLDQDADLLLKAGEGEFPAGVPDRLPRHAPDPIPRVEEGEERGEGAESGEYEEEESCWGEEPEEGAAASHE